VTILERREKSLKKRQKRGEQTEFLIFSRKIVVALSCGV
jgi:hypothetical protein